MPEMNVGFTRVDGKPAVVAHPAVNLGLAIDLTKPDGTRQLLVPCIKRADQLDFAAFWATYEELVRKARGGSLGRRRPRRDDRDADEPRHHRHRELGAQADVRPGPDRRRRLAGVPGRVAGSGRGDPGAAGRQQDPHADLDLRPPDHPGRPVRGVPAPDPPAPARRARLLRRDLHLPAHPLRADPVGDRHRHQPRLRPQQDRPRPGADPRLPRARPPDGRHRPAGLQAAQAPGPRRRRPRPDAVGPRPGVRRRRIRRRAVHDAARRAEGAGRRVLPDGRHRVHAHAGPRAARVDPAAHRDRAGQATACRAAAHPAHAQRGRGVRDVPADQVRRAEALLASRAASR